MAKRVSEILFPIAVNAALEPSSATFGADLAAATDGDYLLIDVDTQAASTAASQRVQLLVKCTNTAGNAEAKISNIINKGNLDSYSRIDYAASTPRIQTLDTLPAPVAGTSYVIYVSLKNEDNYFLPRRRYEVVADAAITTATALGDAFATLINAQTSVTGVGVVNTTGVLVFTGENVNSATPDLSSNVLRAHEVLFEVAPADNLETIAVARTQEPDPGCGEGFVVRKLEEIYKGYKGHLNNVTFAQVAYGGGYQYQSTFAGTYDLLTIEHKQPMHTNSEGNVPAEKVTVLAAPTGGVLGVIGALTVSVETALGIALA